MSFSYPAKSIGIIPQEKKNLRLKIASKLPVDMIALHACLISNGRTNILISGEHEAGKSTLAKELAKSGFQTIANDFVAVWEKNNQVIVSDINLEKENKNKIPLPISHVIFLQPSHHLDIFRANDQEINSLYTQTLNGVSSNIINKYLNTQVFASIKNIHFVLGNRQTPKRWARSVNNHLAYRSPDRIGIIGMGTIGQGLSNLLVGQDWLSSLNLYSPNQDKLKSLALDLQNAKPSLKINSFEEPDDIFINSDVVVFCFNQNDPSKTISTGNERFRKLVTHAEIISDILGSSPSIKNFTGVILVVTNPVDILSWLTYRLSGLDSNQVFGVGLGLDYKRMKTLTDQDLEVVGEHGDRLQLCQASGHSLIPTEQPELLSSIKTYSNRIREFVARTRFGPTHEILSVISSLRNDQTIRISTKNMDGVFFGDIFLIKQGLPQKRYAYNKSLKENLKSSTKEHLEYQNEVVRYLKGSGHF